MHDPTQALPRHASQRRKSVLCRRKEQQTQVLLLSALSQSIGASVASHPPLTRPTRKPASCAVGCPPPGPSKHPNGDPVGTP